MIHPLRLTIGDSTCADAGLKLFLEEIFKRLPRILRLHGRRCRGLFLHPYANRVERAVVPFVFSRDPFCNRLCALKTARGVEVSALAAGMKFASALWAPLVRIDRTGQQGAALGAARDCARSRHLQGPRAESVFARRLR